MNISNVLIELDKTSVLEHLDFRDIYSFYLGKDLVYNRAFSSPFRQDKNPSFIINGSTGIYKDFATGDSGDCFSFVKKLYSVNFYDALKQIVHDLGIADKFNIIERTIQKSKKLKVENVSKRGSLHGDFNLQVKLRKFKQCDLDYWNSYGISLKYLKAGRIYPISHYFINGKQFIAEKYAYVYVEVKDGVESYKVYQPLSHHMKWINGNTFAVWELWRTLPKTHDKLIITSSRKDALSIIENCRIPSTSFQAESVRPKDHVIQDILQRFQKVYLLYDNDYDKEENWGQNHAVKRLEQCPELINLVIPDHYKSKDFSDLVYNHGRIKAHQILDDMIAKTHANYL